MKIRTDNDEKRQVLILESGQLAQCLLIFTQAYGVLETVPLSAENSFSFISSFISLFSSYISQIEIIK